MSRKGGKRSAEMVMRLVALGAHELMVQLGLPEQQAHELMREIAFNLARDYGGQNCYIPRYQEFEMTKRDLLIYEELDGSNVNEVARKHNLTVRQIYAINSFVRDQQVRKRQGKLPGFEDPNASPA